jgi:hypothetical protein
VIRVLFFILRLAIALGAVAVLGLTLAVFIALNFIELVKGGAAVFKSVVVLFWSGFKDSTPPPAPSTVIPPAVIGIAITFLSMFISVFLPRQKIFLHVVAAMSIAAGAWDFWRAAHSQGSDALLWPVILLWFVYYGICLRRA